MKRYASLLVLVAALACGEVESRTALVGEKSPDDTGKDAEVQNDVGFVDGEQCLWTFSVDNQITSDDVAYLMTSHLKRDTRCRTVTAYMTSHNFRLCGTAVAEESWKSAGHSRTLRAVTSVTVTCGSVVYTGTTAQPLNR